MTELVLRARWRSDGLRWIGGLFLDAADWLDRNFTSDPALSSRELYFDSDAYLAEVKNGVRQRSHYY